MTAFPRRPGPPKNVEPLVERLFADGLKILCKNVDQAFGPRVLFIGENGDTSHEGIRKFDAAKARAVELFDYPEQATWINDFVFSVRARNRKTLRTPEFAHRHCTCAHLANISYWLGGRTVKFDPVKEQIVGDAEANALLTRTYRDPLGAEHVKTTSFSEAP